MQGSDTLHRISRFLKSRADYAQAVEVQEKWTEAL